MSSVRAMVGDEKGFLEGQDVGLFVGKEGLRDGATEGGFEGLTVGD
jgi:hypothetical protein